MMFNFIFNNNINWCSLILELYFFFHIEWTRGMSALVTYQVLFFGDNCFVNKNVRFQKVSDINLEHLKKELGLKLQKDQKLYILVSSKNKFIPLKDDKDLEELTNGSRLRVFFKDEYKKYENEINMDKEKVHMIQKEADLRAARVNLTVELTS